MIVYDSQRRQIKLDGEIGQGGEAIIYKLVNLPDQFAKIYTVARPGYDKKLAWMLINPPEDPTQTLGHASIAWPQSLLYDSRRNFIGYLMPRIRDAVPLLQVFNPRLRAQTLPGFDTRYLHRSARNLAIALGALHARDYVVGDLNESNVLVTPSALVTLVDTDSFQAQEQDEARLVFYPCPVGKLEYTAPELQGKSFQRTPRQPEHDYFGLAVLIFQLLMGGSHPFRARWLGTGDPPPIEERICQGCFPYLPKPPCPVAPPNNAPSLDVLHPRLADLVRRCFIEGHARPQQRPGPAAWAVALTEAEEALVACRNGHYYAKHLRSCPECGSKRAGRPATRSQPKAAPVRPPQTGAPAPVRPVICPQCGTPNPVVEIYCQFCGSQLGGSHGCPYCHRSVPLNAGFCPYCGRKF